MLKCKNFFYFSSNLFFNRLGDTFFVNPITASMSKYYEKTKSNYSRDIDHLVTFYKNGIWIKENIENGSRIISAAKPEGKELLDVTILHLDQNFNLSKKIKSKKVNIQDYEWLLKDVTVFNLRNGTFQKNEISNTKIEIKI